MQIDLFVDDLDGYSNEDKFRALEGFCRTRTSEGWRLDYAEMWDDRALLKVASFANTFGGLLIIGVQKGKGDADPLLVGVQSDVEYKTRIASSIAANISPVPSYYLYEFHKPSDQNVRFCLVQTRNVNGLHLITRKNTAPIYIRNEDETKPADAASVRSLLDRSKNITSGTLAMQPLAEAMFNQLSVRCNCKSLSGGRESYEESASFLKIVYVPMENRLSSLEKSREDKLKGLITSKYPRVMQTVDSTVSTQSEDRDSRFFEWIWYHENVDWEMRWRITDDGGIAFATQVKLKSLNSNIEWSIVDLCDFLSLFLRLTVDWCEYVRYFGDGSIFARIATDGFPLSRNKHGAFGSLLNPYAKNRDLRWIPADAVRYAHLGRTSGTTSHKIATPEMKASVVPTVVALSNNLLRNLGHLVDIHAMQRALTSID